MPLTVVLPATVTKDPDSDTKLSLNDVGDMNLLCVPVVPLTDDPEARPMPLKNNDPATEYSLLAVIAGAPLGKTIEAVVMPLPAAGVELPSGHPTQMDVGACDVVVSVVNAPGRGCADAEAATSNTQSVSQILMREP
jgi:hypothetical protein